MNTEAATDTYSSVKNVAGSALTGLSDMLTDLMVTGKASIKSFGMSMLKMIAEVVNRLMVAYAIQAAMGWISGSASGGGSTPGGAYTTAASGVTFNAKGGVYESSGLSKYVNGVYDSPQYFTFGVHLSSPTVEYSLKPGRRPSCHWQKTLPGGWGYERRAVVVGNRRST